MTHKLLIAAGVAAAILTGPAAAQPAGGPGGRMARFFADADANHDGNITRAEWNTARANQFAQMDTNHDGQISADEHPHHGDHGGGQPPAGGNSAGGDHHGMMNPDTNNDGIISRAEFDAQSAAMFSHLDADNNGTISAAELQAMRDRMHQH
jgi:hypothetical protein